MALALGLWAVLLPQLAQALPAAPRPALVRKTLPGGLRVVVAPDASAGDVTVAVSFHVDPADEPPGAHGATAQVARGLAASGSRAHGPHATLIAKAGGATAMRRSQAVTSFITRVPRGRLDLALWVARARFSPKTALPSPAPPRAATGTPATRSRARALTTLRGLAFAGHGGRGLPPTHALLPASVREAQRTAHFTLDRGVVTIVGAVDATDALRRVAAALDPAPSAARASRPPRTPRPQSSGRSAMLTGGRAWRAGVSVGWNIPGRGHADHPALEVCAALLAGPRSAVARKLIAGGKAWSSRAGVDGWPRRDLLWAHAALPRRSDPSEVAASVVRLAAGLAGRGPTAGELRDAQARMRRRALEELDDPVARVHAFARAELLDGDAMNAVQRVDRHAKVTVDDVRRVARTHLAAAAATVVESFASPIRVRPTKKKKAAASAPARDPKPGKRARKPSKTLRKPHKPRTPRRKTTTAKPKPRRKSKARRRRRKTR